jgi:hypothetical protein
VKTSTIEPADKEMLWIGNLPKIIEAFAGQVRFEITLCRITSSYE